MMSGECSFIEFDDRCWSAEAQGVMVKRSSYIEQSSAIKMQGLS
jgi:hypothetical protein